MSIEEWDEIIEDDAFKKESPAVRAKVAENFFKQNFAADKEFLSYDPDTQNKIKTNFFNTIKPKYQFGKSEVEAVKTMGQTATALITGVGGAVAKPVVQLGAQIATGDFSPYVKTGHPVIDVPQSIVKALKSDPTQAREAGEIAAEKIAYQPTTEHSKVFMEKVAPYLGIPAILGSILTNDEKKALEIGDALPNKTDKKIVNTVAKVLQKGGTPIRAVFESMGLEGTPQDLAKIALEFYGYGKVVKAGKSGFGTGKIADRIETKIGEKVDKFKEQFEEPLGMKPRTAVEQLPEKVGAKKTLSQESSGVTSEVFSEFPNIGRRYNFEPQKILDENLPRNPVNNSLFEKTIVENGGITKSNGAETTLLFNQKGEKVGGIRIVNERGEVKFQEGFLDKSIRGKGIAQEYIGRYPDAVLPKGAATEAAIKAFDKSKGKEPSKPVDSDLFTDTKPTKAALDINKTLAEKGLKELPESELAQYNPITKNSIVQKVSDLVTTNEKLALEIAKGKEPLPPDVHPQVLFNVVEKIAKDKGDFNTLYDLAKSPIAEQRSLAGQTLGASAWEKTSGSFVEKLQTVKRERTNQLRKSPEEVSRAKQKIHEEVKKNNLTKEEANWNKFLKEIIC